MSADSQLSDYLSMLGKADRTTAEWKKIRAGVKTCRALDPNGRSICTIFSSLRKKIGSCKGSDAKARNIQADVLYLEERRIGASPGDGAILPASTLATGSTPAASNTQGGGVDLSPGQDVALPLLASAHTAPPTHQRHLGSDYAAPSSPRRQLDRDASVAPRGRKFEVEAIRSGDGGTSGGSGSGGQVDRDASAAARDRKSEVAAIRSGDDSGSRMSGVNPEGIRPNGGGSAYARDSGGMAEAMCGGQGTAERGVTKAVGCKDGSSGTSDEGMGDRAVSASHLDGGGSGGRGRRDNAINVRLPGRGGRGVGAFRRTARLRPKGTPYTVVHETTPLHVPGPAGVAPAGGAGNDIRRDGLVDPTLKLTASADDSSRYNLGRTDLHKAAERGDRDEASTLLRAGACVDCRCLGGITPLILAALGGHGDTVRLLLRAGAGKQDRPGEAKCEMERRTTALHYAAEGGSVDVVSALLDAGFEREQRDEVGLIPAEISARETHATSPAATHLLLGDASAERGGHLVFEYAHMVAEDVDTVRGLILGGSSPCWQHKRTRETALHRAAFSNHRRIAEVLLEAGAEPHVRNAKGASPLHVAASVGSLDVMAALLDAGADCEVIMDNGRSPLHLAVTNNKPGAVLLLLRAGATTEHRDLERGQTPPLSEASEYMLAPIIEQLVEAKADVEARSNLGLTPLHWACRVNSPESVAVLLAAGADLEAVDPAAAAATGRTTRLPKAADVVGLGDPNRSDENPRKPFLGEIEHKAEQRLNPKARSAIMDLVKKTRKWRRRGWLVVLAKQRRDIARASACGTIQSDARIGGSAASRKRPRLAGARVGGGIEDGTGPQEAANDNSRHVGSSRLSARTVVDALVELGCEKPGVFRTVLSYI